MQRHLKQHSEAANGLGGHPGQGHHGGGHHPGQPHPQHPHQHHPHQASIDLNPMDFIEHDPSSHPIIPSFDLDPFDMLGEFSELDQYGGSKTIEFKLVRPFKIGLVHNWLQIESCKQQA